MVKVKRRKKRKDRLLEQSSIFAAFGRLLQTTAGKSMLQAERDEVLAKVCTGLSKVCKMLAEGQGGNHGKRDSL